MKNSSPFGNLLQVSFPNYKDFRDRNTVFTGLAAYSFPIAVSATIGPSPEQLFCEMVTGDYFPVLGVRPARGRFFGPEDDRVPGAAPVLVLSYTAWQRRFGGSADVIGRTIALNGSPFTIVAVAPNGFNGVNSLFGPDGWVYVTCSSLQHVLFIGADHMRAHAPFQIFRFKPGTTAAPGQ